MKVLIITKKHLLIITCLLITIALGSILLTVFFDSEKDIHTFSPINRKVIVIDPGHGGIDGGAVGRSTGIYESRVNLDIGLKLRRYLEEAGCIVIMTRDTDVGLYTDSGTIRKKKNEDLRNRKVLFDNCNADLVLSIHLNSFPQGQYYGAQTFYPNNSDTSKYVAESIQDSFVRVLDNNNKRKAKMKRDVYILKNVRTPTVIVECGFLSNSNEEQLLRSDKYQEKVAWSIYLGLMEYFNNDNVQ